ncbi:LptF/LptG family permease, partial [uncultured Maritalea sp.]|uniref:LptF/LptG family permease n=1 Tax=uncultured Maritalea sp. TaxID=757249 RepID=UPI00261F0606
MTHVARYLLSKYFAASIGFVLLLAFLGWMVQLLRTIDVVTAKGQGVFTLFSQSLLVVPEVISIILYLCLALGVSRGLRAMQVSKELFPIHSGIGIKPLWQSIGLFLLISIIFDATLVHQLVPKTNQLAAARADEINADLIANSSRPGQFTDIAPDLTLMIAGRADDGTGLGFFLHDARDPLKNQTTFAAQSQLSRADDTLYIKLKDGAIQYFNTKTQTMSTLEFGTYSVAVRELASSNLFAAIEPTSLELVSLVQSGALNNAP